MKPLILTNHALKQYATRTGRCENVCVAELFNSIRAGEQMTYKEALDMGFKITRAYKGDTYFVWYDPRVDEKVVAIVAKDGAIKTVMTINLYGYWADHGIQEGGQLNEEQDRRKYNRTHDKRRTRAYSMRKV